MKLSPRKIYFIKGMYTPEEIQKYKYMNVISEKESFQDVIVLKLYNDLEAAKANSVTDKRAFYQQFEEYKHYVCSTATTDNPYYPEEV